MLVGGLLADCMVPNGGTSGTLHFAARQNVRIFLHSLLRLLKREVGFC